MGLNVLRVAYPFAPVGPDATGGAEAQLHEVARVLRPGGHPLPLNYSYLDDAALDGDEIARFARDAGFAVLRLGTRDLALWDGRVFLPRKPSEPNV